MSAESKPGPGTTPPVAPGASINEEVFYAGGPAKGDLITNLLFGFTLIGIPFAVAALVRALWLRFRITSRRVEVSGGWLGRDRTQVVYSQIREVRTAPRGLGFWGDMVLVLSDGMKLEMRAVPHYKEAEAYILGRMAASPGARASAAADKPGFGGSAAA
jgi:hypothetical protein